MTRALLPQNSSDFERAMADAMAPLFLPGEAVVADVLGHSDSPERLAVVLKLRDLAVAWLRLRLRVMDQELVTAISYMERYQISLLNLIRGLEAEAAEYLESILAFRERTPADWLPIANLIFPTEREIYHAMVVVQGYVDRLNGATTVLDFVQIAVEAGPPYRDLLVDIFGHPDIANLLLGGRIPPRVTTLLAQLQDWGGAPLLALSDDLQAVHKVARRWNQLRSTPESVRLAISTVGLEGELRETELGSPNWDRVQVFIEGLPTRQTVGQVVTAASLSLPLRTSLFRIQVGEVGFPMLRLSDPRTPLGNSYLGTWSGDLLERSNDGASATDDFLLVEATIHWRQLVTVSVSWLGEIEFLGTLSIEHRPVETTSATWIAPSQTWQQAGDSGVRWEARVDDAHRVKLTAL